MSNQRPKNQKPRIFKQLKSFASNDESKAKDLVLQRTGLKPKDLKAGNHTKKTFFFIEK